MRRNLLSVAALLFGTLFLFMGNGLQGMGERLQALGGELRIDARAGAGTELQARLPWPDPRREVLDATPA